MAVAIDAQSTAFNLSSAGVTTATHTSLTIGASLSNGALIFGVIWKTTTTTPSAPAAHWDSTGTNQLMTLIGTLTDASGSGAGNSRIALFGLRNPTSGNKTFSVSWTTASQCTMFGISFTGVDQTSDANAFPNFNSATDPNNTSSSTPSVVINSAVGDIVVGAITSPFSNLSSINNTQLFLTNTTVISAMNQATGASTVTMSGVLGQNDWWAIAGVDVAAAAAVIPSGALMAQIWI